ncbi:MAG: PH domain-containing protein [Ruminococcaceae bacterium]|nr:PH domain-containing protein [Oscillospiraceae bacterium]MBQ2757694.1 PH domain-containing protein [Clostridia bacterium]
MNPNYVAQKSIVKAFTPLCVLFFWLIIPAFIIVFRIIALKSERFEFYDDHVIHKYGVLNKNEDRKPFFRVNGVNFKQSLLGSIFNYGDLIVDATGKWDFALDGIKDPRALKTFLETRGARESDFQNIVHN